MGESNERSWLQIVENYLTGLEVRLDEKIQIGERKYRTVRLKLEDFYLICDGLKEDVELNAGARFSYDASKLLELVKQRRTT